MTDNIARVMYEPKNKKQIEIDYVENERGEGWYALVCRDDRCCFALEGDKELSDNDAIGYAGMILDEIGIKNIPCLRLEREGRVTLAISPFLKDIDLDE